MRSSVTICFALILLAASRSPAQQSHPALMAPGPHALINLIDSEGLMKRGQGDAVVRFDFFVSSLGTAYRADAYLRSDKSDALAQEIVDKCERSKWIPAVWHGEQVTAVVAATAIFAVIDGKPHVRIFLNQEEEHLKHGDDFIAPQAAFSYRDKFNGFYDPDEGRYSGIVSVKLQLDKTGKVLGVKAGATNRMAGRGYCKSIEDKINTIIFIPAYSHGVPVASSTTWNIAYQGWGHNKSWMSD